MRETNVVPGVGSRSLSKAAIGQRGKRDFLLVFLPVVDAFADACGVDLEIWSSLKSQRIEQDPAHADAVAITTIAAIPREEYLAIRGCRGGRLPLEFLPRGIDNEVLACRTAVCPKPASANLGVGRGKYV